MTEQEAMAVAHAHLARRIRLQRIDPGVLAQQGAYLPCGGDLHDHRVYRYSLDSLRSIGASLLLAVSVVDGHVDELGRVGE